MFNLPKKLNILILTAILIAGFLVWTGWQAWQTWQIRQAMAADIGNSSGYAFSERVGWIKFDGAGSTPDYGVTVSNTILTGYAWSENAGWIQMASLGASCIQPGGGCVSDYAYSVANDGTGKLSGFAWGEGIGWIRFAATGSDYTNTSSTNYGVYIDSGSNFNGYAWSDQVGWIHFKDATSYSYGVITDWVPPPPVYTLATTTGKTIVVHGDLTIGDGTNAVTVTGVTNDPILDVDGDVSIAASATFVAPGSSSFTVGGDWTKNATAIFTHNSGAVSFNGASAQSISGANTWYGLAVTTSTARTVSFQSTVAQTIAANGSLTFTGVLGQLLTLAPLTAATNWLLSINNTAVTQSVSYVSVSYSDATGVTGANTAVNATNGTNSGTFTTNWNFGGAGITVSGIIRQADESAAFDCSGANNVTLELRVNGVGTSSTACTLATGAYQFTGITAVSGDIITVWANTPATYLGSVVYSSDGANEAALDLYQNRVIVRYDDAGPITNTDLDQCDRIGPAACADADIGFDVTTSNLTVSNGFELHIWTGDTYGPGGTVTTQGAGGNLHVDDSAVAYFDTSTNTISGDITIDTLATLNFDADTTINGGDLTSTGTTQATAGTATFGATGVISGAGSINFYNLATSGTGTTTISNATSTDSDITVGAGTTLKVNADTTVNGGDFTNTTTGIITTDANTPTVTMTAAGNVGGGSGAITFYNLATSGTGATSFSGSGTNTVNNNVAVGAGTTLNINSTISIAGSITNATTGIIGTSAGTPTVTVSGASIGGGSGAITFYNLTKAGAGATTFSGSGTNTVNNDLSVSAGTLNLSNALIVAGDGSVAAGATFNINANLNIDGGDLTTAATGIINYTAGTPTVDIDGTGTLGGGAGAITFYSLDLGDGTADTTTLSSTISIDNNLTVNGSQTFTVGTNSIAVGSTVVNSGGISVAASGAYNQTGGTTTIKSSSAGAATIGGAGTITFYNLSFLPAVAAAPTFTLGSAVSQTINVSNTLTIGNGTNPAAVTVSSTYDPTFNVDGDVSIAASGTLTASDGGTFTVGGSWSNSATGTFTHSSGTVTFDAGAAGKTITDGGDPFNNITFNNAVGGWTYQDGSSTAPALTTVTNGTALYLNAKTGPVSVTAGGTLNVDWYLGTHLVDAATPATNIETGTAADITILEKSGTPVATIWRHNGAIWGSAATSQTTGTASSGINPQPTADGAIRVREYSMTASATCPGVGCILYNYNLAVAWQTVYGLYDYYDDYGGEYLTSCLKNGAACDNDTTASDDVIGVSWYRSTAGSINSPYTCTAGSGNTCINQPPNNGSWLVGMLTGLDVSFNSTSVTFNALNYSVNSFTSNSLTPTIITVTTSATNGYAITAWETQKMTHSDYGGVTIPNWTGTYAATSTWTGNCIANTQCGFGFTSDDDSVGGADRYWNGGGNAKYAGFSEDSADPIRVADSSGPIVGNINTISYRISTSATQPAGVYDTTIVYVITAEY